MPCNLVDRYERQGKNMVLTHTNTHLISIYNFNLYFSNCYATQLITFDAFMINESWIF